MSIDKKTLQRIFLGIAACILLFWLLHETERVRAVFVFFKDMLSPFIAGAILAFIINVPMRGIENKLGVIGHKAVRRAVALTLTFIFILLVLMVVFLLLIPQVIDTIGGLIERISVLLEEHPQLLKWLKLSEGDNKIDWYSLFNQAVNNYSDGIPSILNGAMSAIGSVYTGIFNAVIAIVFSIYCLARKDILAHQSKRLAYAFLPEKVCDTAVYVLSLTNSTFSNFISGQCIEACILGCLFAIAMTIFQMPYVALISVLIGITALIPIVGAFIGCGLGAFFILVTDPMKAVWFVVMFLIIQQIENNVIYPKVVGKSVGLPGMWVLVSVTVGGALMGVMGMLLMIPVVSVIYTLLREVTNYRIDKRGINPEKLSSNEEDYTKRKSKKKKKKQPPKDDSEDAT